jgi:EpsI family protein
MIVRKRETPTFTSLLESAPSTSYHDIFEGTYCGIRALRARTDGGNNYVNRSGRIGHLVLEWVMRVSRVHIILASMAVLTAAVLANVLAPRALMARTSAPHDLSKIVPRQFAAWTYVPSIGLVTPFVNEVRDDDSRVSAIYNQVLGRGYRDANGNIVMLMVAYGQAQDSRLKAHRPEFCYVAAGFRISSKSEATVSYLDGARPLTLTRLIAERESRLEPVSYWMRIGDEISHGAVDRQLIRLKYGLRGIVADGALIRVSTVGLAPEASFKVQDQFIRDLLTAIRPEDRPFFTGGI